MATAREEYWVTIQVGGQIAVRVKAVNEQQARELGQATISAGLRADQLESMRFDLAQVTDVRPAMERAPEMDLPVEYQAPGEES